MPFALSLQPDPLEPIGIGGSFELIVECDYVLFIKVLIFWPEIKKSLRKGGKEGRDKAGVGYTS